MKSQADTNKWLTCIVIMFLKLMTRFLQRSDRKSAIISKMLIYHSFFSLDRSYCNLPKFEIPIFEVDLKSNYLHG